MPEFSNSRAINVTTHAKETTKPDKAQYDMIIGTDLREQLKLDMLFKNKTKAWEIPLCVCRTLEQCPVETLWKIFTK